MKDNQTMQKNVNHRLKRILLGATALLAIPFILQLTIGSGIDGQGFNWTPFDFLIMGLLLYSVGFIIEVVLRTVKTTRNRILLIAVALFVFLLVWADLAVGIFNIPGFSGS